MLVVAPVRASSPDSPARQVEVVLVGAIGREATLPARIRSWFDPAEFVVAVRASDVLDVRRVLGPNGDRVAHVWVTSPTPEHARFYFAMASQGESTTVYLMRDLPLEHGLDELAAERIAQVCYLSTIALVEGQAESRKDEVERSLRAEQTESSASPAKPRTDSPQDEQSGPGSAEEPERTAKSTPEPSNNDGASSARQRTEDASRSLLRFGVGYGLRLRGDEGIGHGPRAGVAARFPAFGVLAAVHSDLPSTATLGRLDLHLYALSFVAGVELRRDVRALTITLHAGPGLDVVHYRPEPTDAAVHAGATATEVRPSIDVGTSVELGPGLPRFAIVADLAVPFSRTHYDLVTGNQRAVVGRAWPVVPTFGAELRF